MKKKKRSTKGLYRDGKLLVIREGAKFPDRCAICNKPCDGDNREFTFGRDKAHYVEVAAVQAVTRTAGDFLTGAKYTGPVQAEIPLCSWHQGRRLQRAGIGVGMMVLGAGFLLIQKAMGYVIVPHGELGFLNISLHNFIAFAVAFVGIGVAMTAVFDAHNLWFKATKYYDRFVWVSGAGQAFLAELPSIKDHDYNPRADNPNLSADELIRRSELDEE